MRYFCGVKSYVENKAYLSTKHQKGHSKIRPDHQPLLGKGARAPPPKFLSGRDVDQSRENGGNRAYSKIKTSKTSKVRLICWIVIDQK